MVHVSPLAYKTINSRFYRSAYGTGLVGFVETTAVFFVKSFRGLGIKIVAYSSVGIDELMSRSGVRFGTSGARGLVAEMTDEVCYAYTAAFLQAVAGSSGGVVLGHDLLLWLP